MQGPLQAAPFSSFSSSHLTEAHPASAPAYAALVWNFNPPDCSGSHGCAGSGESCPQESESVDGEDQLSRNKPVRSIVSVYTAPKQEWGGLNYYRECQEEAREAP